MIKIIFMFMIISYSVLANSSPLTAGVDGVSSEDIFGGIMPYLVGFIRILQYTTTGVGLMVYLWSVIKSVKGQQIDIAELLLNLCQLLFMLVIVWKIPDLVGWVYSSLVR